MVKGEDNTVKKILVCTILLLTIINSAFSQNKRIRDYGIKIGSYLTGEKNSITDVAGVAVGHVTLVEDQDIRTGVTVILPHQDNIFQQKVPAAIYVANGFGKLTGYSQVEELGNIETPIILTNTLSVPTAADALIDYTLSFEENKSIRSVNPVVGETNDGKLNNIQKRYIKKRHVLQAIKNAESDNNEEGSVGAGTGTICFGYKGGIGTSSRVLPEINGGYTIGVLVQTNFGGDLTIAGIPLERELKKNKDTSSGDGSCMIIVATDAPIKARNLKRLAKRAVFGLARTGGNGSNGSGDYVIAFSVAKELRMSYKSGDSLFDVSTELRNDRITPLFEAVAEATEEAILNSLFAAETMVGKDNLRVESLPVERVIQILRYFNRLN
jgi:D-aminopeptidase